MLLKSHVVTNCDYVMLLCAQGLICALCNGILPSIQSYASMPYGEDLSLSSSSSSSISLSSSSSISLYSSSSISIYPISTIYPIHLPPPPHIFPPLTCPPPSLQATKRTTYQ